MTYQIFYFSLYYVYDVNLINTPSSSRQKYYANMGPKPHVQKTGAYSCNEYEISNKGFRLYPQ